MGSNPIARSNKFNALGDLGLRTLFAGVTFGQLQLLPILGKAFRISSMDNFLRVAGT